MNADEMPYLTGGGTEFLLREETRRTTGEERGKMINFLKTKDSAHELGLP